MHPTQPKRISNVTLLLIALAIIWLNKDKLKNTSEVSSEISKMEETLPALNFSEPLAYSAGTAETSLTKTFYVNVSSPFDLALSEVNDKENSAAVIFDKNASDTLILTASKVTIAGKGGMEQYVKYTSYTEMHRFLDSKNLEKLSGSVRAFRSGYIPSVTGLMFLKNSKLNACHEITVNGRKGFLFSVTDTTHWLFHLLLWESPEKTEYTLFQLHSKFPLESEPVKKIIESLVFK